MLKVKIGIAAILLTIFTNTYADDPDTVEQGAQGYDWQSCVDLKSNSCINNCATSSDIHCNEDCVDMAKDKCLSQGLKPPQ